MNINIVDGRYILQPGFDAPDREKLKLVLSGRKFDWDTKEWSAPINARNNWQIKYQWGEENPYEPYDQEVIPIDLLAGQVNRRDPWTHQTHMKSHVKQRKQCIIAGEPRTGKTAPVIEAAIELEIPDIWWIAPVSALKSLGHEMTEVGYPYKYYAMSYEKFRNIWTEGMMPPRFIVFDEFHKLKGLGVTWKSAMSLREAQIKTYGMDHYCILMSGTPVPKNPSDWWAGCEVAQSGFLAEKSKIDFEAKYAIYEENKAVSGHTFRKIIGWKGIEEIPEILKGLVEVYLKKDCLDLPDRLYETVYCPPTKEQIETAKYFMNNTDRAATLQIYLRQISDGFMYSKEYSEVTGKDTVTTDYIECGKDAQLLAHLEEFDDIGRLIIGVGFKGSLQKVTRMCVQEGWTVLQVSGNGWYGYENVTMDGDKSKEYVDKLLAEMDASRNTGTVEKLAFVCQVDSGSMGLELSAAPIMIFYSNSENGASRMQFEDRNHSVNTATGLQTSGLDKITVIDYDCLPIDGLVLARHRNKQSMQKITMKDIEEVMNPLTKETV